jgi:hypothetical protein
VTLVALVAALPTPAQDAPPAALPEPPGYAERAETEHFVLLARKGEATAEQLRLAGERAEAWFAPLRELLGEERMPTVKLQVLLEGSGLETGANSHVDGAGRIHLYRFTEQFEDHLDSLLHEMVHAFRRTEKEPFLGFDEEGLAQAIEAHLWPERSTFPLFGFSPDVVAGYLQANELAIPLGALRLLHGTYTRRCALQTYALRASFFAFLRQTYGIEAVIALAYDHAGESDSYAAAFGAPFGELIASWSVWLESRYRQIPDRDARWRRYRTESPAQYQPICEDWSLDPPRGARAPGSSSDRSARG